MSNVKFTYVSGPIGATAIYDNFSSYENHIIIDNNSQNLGTYAYMGGVKFYGADIIDTKFASNSTVSPIPDEEINTLWNTYTH